MSFVAAFFRRVAAAASWVARWRGLYGAVDVTELPDRLEPRILYVVGEDGHRWFAAFFCPCGCGETIQASLLEPRSFAPAAAAKPSRPRSWKRAARIGVSPRDGTAPRPFIHPFGERRAVGVTFGCVLAECGGADAAVAQKVRV